MPMPDPLWIANAERGHELAAVKAERDALQAELDRLISEHEGALAVWVCDRCGQPLGQDGRCNSGAHVGPREAASGVAVATTDLVAERDAAIADRDALLEAIAASEFASTNAARQSLYDTASAIRDRVAAERRTQ